MDPQNKSSEASAVSRFGSWLKEYKELIAVLVFFIGGGIWMYNIFATQRQLSDMGCHISANIELLSSEIELQKLPRLYSENLASQQTLKAKSKSSSDVMARQLAELQGAYRMLLAQEKDALDKNKEAQDRLSRADCR